MGSFDIRNRTLCPVTEGGRFPCILPPITAPTALPDIHVPVPNSAEENTPQFGGHSELGVQYHIQYRDHHVSSHRLLFGGLLGPRVTVLPVDKFLQEAIIVRVPGVPLSFPKWFGHAR